MNDTDFSVSGTITKYGDAAFLFEVHSIFATLEPSGKCLPSAGRPSLYAAIIVGLATITLIPFSVCLTATSSQFSYPRKSENASPLGTCKVYLSCAASAMLPKTASNTTMITIGEDGFLVMARSCAFVSQNQWRLFKRCCAALARYSFRASQHDPLGAARLLLHPNGST